MHTHTHLLHLSFCLNGDEHFVWPGTCLHLLPPSTLSCSPTERQETIEKTKGSEDDGRLLPDILRTEIKKDRVGGLIFGLFLAVIHSGNKAAALQQKNEYCLQGVCLDSITICKKVTIIPATIHFYASALVE